MIRVLLLTLALGGAGRLQQEIEPALRAAVDRFFATQTAEDAEAYLALWSRTAQRPQLQQLKFIFESGDDRFLDLEITRAVMTGNRARLRVAVTRVRTALNSTNPDGSPRLFSSRLQLSLEFVQEDGAWKLVREGAPADELAGALIATPDAAVRAEMLKRDADLVTARLLEALSRRADQLAQQNQYKGALGIYELALEVARAMADRKAEGQMLQNIANSHYFLRDFPMSLATYEKRLAVEREAANDDGIASALLGIATIRYSTYEYTAALERYREALSIQERLNDEGLVATTLISTGNVLYVQGDFEGAIADYRRAEMLKRKYFDLGGAAMALEGLGRTYAAQGNHSAALIAFSGVLDQARKRNDSRRQASALQNIGDTHFRLANLDAARSAYDESRQHYEKARDLANAGRLWQGTAATELLSGRFAAAEAAYAKSIAACSAGTPTSDDAECVARALVGLAFAQSAQERYDEAIASYRKGIAAYELLKETENAARARVGLAEALSGKEQYAAAIETAIDARRTAVVLEADDLLWRALIAQARAQHKLGKKAESLGAAKAAVSAVQRMAAAALQRPGHAVPRDTTAAFATAVMLHAEHGDAAAAWTTAEEMRAHALRAALAINERDIARGMTEEERGVERAAVADLTPLFAQRDREKSLPKPDAVRLERLGTAIREATGKWSASQQQLFNRLPDLRTWRGLAPAATLDEIKRVAESGTLLVQLVLDERDLLVLTAERSADGVNLGAHVVAVKRQAVAERVARAVDLSALADAETWRRASADLMKLLPAAVVAQLASARRIIFVPDDILWRVPFEALPIETGYVGDQATVTYAASVTSIVRAPSSTAPPPVWSVVIAAAPEIPTAVVETLKTTAPSWTLRSAEVAEKEAARVRSSLDEETARVLMKADATEEAVRGNGATTSVLHFGAPFRLNAASPLFSPILLSRPEPADGPSSQNGILEAREIPNAELATRLAVFSDPAALSMREAAAALPAFQWIWRAGGIETLIVRRWGGDESASADLLAAFYERLRAGASAADAMHSARAAARKSSAPPQAWAGWLVLSAR